MAWQIERPGSELGWRVSCFHAGEWKMVVSKKKAFASRRDAEAAMRALIAAGLTTAEKIVSAGPIRANDIMFSALPW